MAQYDEATFELAKRVRAKTAEKLREAGYDVDDREPSGVMHLRAQHPASRPAPHLAVIGDNKDRVVVTIDDDGVVDAEIVDDEDTRIVVRDLTVIDDRAESTERTSRGNKSSKSGRFVTKSTASRSVSAFRARRRGKRSEQL